MTINELAEYCGVSVATVSRAFKEKSNINPDTRARILAAAKENDYKPKKYSSSKRLNWKNSAIGVVLDMNAFPFSNNVMHGICEVMNEEGYMVCCASSGDDTKIDLFCLDHLRTMTQGLIVMPSSEQNDYNIQFLKEINKTIPVVTIHRNSSLDNLATVQADNYSTVYDAIKMLINQGHEHIAFISGPMRIKPSHDKLSAYTQALIDNGIPIRGEYICYGEYDEPRICLLSKQMLQQFPKITAIVTANTTITRGCLRAIDELGLKLTQDISLISYGDDPCFALHGLGITAIVEPQVLIGRKAAELLLKMLNSSSRRKGQPREKVVVSSSIAVRGSEKFPSNRLNEKH